MFSRCIFLSPHLLTVNRRGSIPWNVCVCAKGKRALWKKEKTYWRVFPINWEFSMAFLCEINRHCCHPLPESSQSFPINKITSEHSHVCGSLFSSYTFHFHIGIGFEWLASGVTQSLILNISLNNDIDQIECTCVPFCFSRFASDTMFKMEAILWPNQYIWCINICT